MALGATQIDVLTLRPFLPEGTGPGAILPTTALVFVSYLGFAQVATVAGEIKNPGKNLRRRTPRCCRPRGSTTRWAGTA